jgi:ribonuclease J
VNTENNDLAFLPLGGTGEIGMNLNLYQCRGKWLAVDCGIGFGGNETPEVEIMMPDPGYIAERRDKLLGLVITHAHEDHIGAVAHLWRQLRCPVYATPFAVAVLRRKLTEAGLQNEVKLHTIPVGGSFELGAFKLEFMPVTHSLPEAQALVLRTPFGTILHTGDWKLDPDPVIGKPIDQEAFARLGREGVLAMVCDSTNALVDGHSGSEAEVRTSMAEVIAGLKGRVAVTCFASNVARVESIAHAARENGRSVALVGRSLRNLDAAARDTGYLRTTPEFVPEEHASDISDDNLLMLVTGSQGEPRSALARIAADTHPNIALGEGDTVIFSSRMIPGNERAVGIVQSNLARRGVRVITDRDAMVHVSGHPARDELRILYDLVKPRYAVPVHGEWRHLSAHAALAKEAGSIPIMMEDGDVLSLAGNRPEVVDSAPIGRLALDGNRLVPVEGGVLTARRRMLFNGVVIGSLAVDIDGYVLGMPRVIAPGLFEADDPELNRIAGMLADTLDGLAPSLRRDDAALADAARAAIRRALGRRLQKRPSVEIQLIRV